MPAIWSLPPFRFAPGRDQKGFTVQEQRWATGDPRWEVPYLPIDPADLGRSYEAVIRVNSQSGKGGIAYLLEKDHDLRLPRRLQVEFSQRVQAIADATGKELASADIWAAFQTEYLQTDQPFRFIEYRTAPDGHTGGACKLTATVREHGRERPLFLGKGNGPIDAFTDALNRHFGLNVRVVDYHEHAIGAGADATAVSHVEVCMDGDPVSLFESGRRQHRHRFTEGGGQRDQPGTATGIRQDRRRIGCRLMVIPDGWLLCLGTLNTKVARNKQRVPCHQNLRDSTPGHMSPLPKEVGDVETNRFRFTAGGFNVQTIESPVSIPLTPCPLPWHSDTSRQPRLSAATLPCCLRHSESQPLSHNSNRPRRQTKHAVICRVTAARKIGSFHQPEPLPFQGSAPITTAHNESKVFSFTPSFSVE